MKKGQNGRQDGNESQNKRKRNMPGPVKFGTRYNTSIGDDGKVS